MLNAAVRQLWMNEGRERCEACVNSVIVKEGLVNVVRERESACVRSAG